jgi:hypothetical protein
MAATSALWAGAYAELDATPRQLVEKPWRDWLSDEAPRYPALALGTRCAYDLSQPRGERPRIMPACDAPRQGQEVAGAYSRALLREFRPHSRAWYPFTRQQRNLALLNWSAPYWRSRIRPAGDLVVVDLRWAYWQIYSPTTLDLLYDPISGEIARGRIPFVGCDHPELCLDPVSRSSMVSRLNPGRPSSLRRGRPTSGPVPRFWRQPHLWAYVMDVLCAVAWDIRDRYPCWEVATDGYLLRAEDAEAAVAYIKESWLLEARVKPAMNGPDGGGAAVEHGRWISPEVRETLRCGRRRIAEAAPGWHEACAKLLTTVPILS